jgi:hypothetical protein
MKEVPHEVWLKPRMTWLLTVLNNQAPTWNTVLDNLYYVQNLKFMVMQCFITSAQFVVLGTRGRVILIHYLLHKMYKTIS